MFRPFVSECINNPHETFYHIHATLQQKLKHQQRNISMLTGTVKYIEYINFEFCIINVIFK